jgi:hypothetical protein
MSHSHDAHDGHMFGSSDHADSAGQPWEGRAFDQNPFAADDGTAPAVYLDALAEFRSHAHDDEARYWAQARVLDAIRLSRFLIPLLAEAGDVGVNAAGLVVDKTQELAIVTVEGPGGQRVLPVFSSVAAMQAWNPQARPVPAEARRVALAAAADGADWVVIDPTSATEYVLRRPAVEAVAQASPWVPNTVDPMLRHVLDASIEDEPFIHAIRLVAGDPQARGFDEDLIVQLVLNPNLEEAELTRIVQSLSQKWAHEAIFSERVDSMKLVLIPAVSGDSTQ